VIEGADAIEGCRTTNGATNPIKAAPGTIRGDFGQTIGRNLVHASDSPESAKREIPIWFETSETHARPHDQERWLIET
jgi:nucleoside-diphosphate kinase